MMITLKSFFTVTINTFVVMIATPTYIYIYLVILLVEFCQIPLPWSQRIGVLVAGLLRLYVILLRWEAVAIADNSVCFVIQTPYVDFLCFRGTISFVCSCKSCNCWLVYSFGPWLSSSSSSSWRSRFASSCSSLFPRNRLGHSSVIRLSIFCTFFIFYRISYGTW